MEKKERIISTAKLYIHFTSELHDIKKCIVDCVNKKDNMTFDFNLSTAAILERNIIEPLMFILQEDDVVRISGEKDCTKILLENGDVIRIDEVMVDPFRVDFPMDLNPTYADEDLHH